MGLGKTLRKLKLNATSSTTSPAGSPGVGNHNASDSEDSDSSFGCVDAKDVEALHGLQQDQSSKHPSLVSPAATPQQQQQVQFACEWCGRTVLPGKEEEIKDVAGLEKLCQKCAAANSKWVVCGTCKLKDTRHPGGKCRSCRGSSKSPRNSEVSFASTAEMVGSSRAKGNEDGECFPAMIEGMEWNVTKRLT